MAARVTFVDRLERVDATVAILARDRLSRRERRLAAGDDFIPFSRLYEITADHGRGLTAGAR
jgi:hypothetical protein